MLSASIYNNNLESKVCNFVFMYWVVVYDLDFSLEFNLYGTAYSRVVEYPVSVGLLLVGPFCNIFL